MDVKGKAEKGEMEKKGWKWVFKKKYWLNRLPGGWKYCYGMKHLHNLDDKRCGVQAIEGFWVVLKPRS